VFTVIVSLRVRPAMVAAFQAAIAENAAASLRDEPGCSRFEVLRDNADPQHYLLYESYDDEDAFTRVHRGSAHFAAWRAVADTLVEGGSQTDTLCTKVFP
jgi:autoinducer 2-degrading protein